MAHVHLKNERRYRVQISLSKEMWGVYQHNLLLARRLKAEIDFSRDFEPWFSRQDQMVKTELERILAEVEREYPEAECQNGAPTNSGFQDELPALETVEVMEDEQVVTSSDGGATNAGH
jgi:hypothetical protein